MTGHARLFVHMAAVTGLLATAAATPAAAWWQGGIGYGPGYGPGYGSGWGYGGGYRSGIYLGLPLPPRVYAPPPVVYAPPAYYPPPPVYLAPSAAQQCYAGPYVCPLDAPAVIGGSCSCPANRGRVFGRAE